MRESPWGWCREGETFHEDGAWAGGEGSSAQSERPGQHQFLPLFKLAGDPAHVTHHFWDSGFHLRKEGVEMDFSILCLGSEGERK